MRSSLSFSHEGENRLGVREHDTLSVPIGYVDCENPKEASFLSPSKPPGYAIPEIETALSGKEERTLISAFAACQEVKTSKTLDFPD